jgi:iron-sulfur cluster assembly accessory protein
MSDLITLGDFTRVAAPQTITVTDAAAERTRLLLERQGTPEGALRVFVVGGGCSGYQYGMALAEGAEDGDVVLEHNGARVVVDEDSARMLAGSEIDYVEDIMKSGFTVFNPNAVKSCACGSSFQTSDGSGVARACH